MSANKPPFDGEWVRLNQLCMKGRSALRQKDLIDGGPYAVYGASGIIGSMSTFQNGARYVAVVKDGAGVGRVNLCSARTSVLGTMQALIPTEMVLPEYLLHLIRAMRLGDGFSGSTIPHIYFKDYGQRLVRYVSMADQERIVGTLGSIEDQIDILHQQNERLDTLVKSRFVEMFGGMKYESVPMGHLVAEIVAGTNVGGKQRPLLKGEYGVLKISAVTRGVFDASQYKVVEDVSSIKMVHPRKGDLLFSRANTSEMVGATAIVDKDCACLFLPDKLWRIDPTDEVNTVFLKALLSSSRMRREISNASTGSSGSMQNISMTKFRSLPAFLPPLALQQEFASFVAEVDKSRFNLLKAYGSIIALFRVLFP